MLLPAVVQARDAALLSLALADVEAEAAGRTDLDRRPAHLPVTLSEVRVPGGEQPTVDPDRDEAAGARPGLLDVHVADVLPWGHRAQRLAGDGVVGGDGVGGIGRERQAATIDQGLLALGRIRHQLAGGRDPEGAEERRPGDTHAGEIFRGRPAVGDLPAHDVGVGELLAQEAEPRDLHREPERGRLDVEHLDHEPIARSRRQANKVKSEERVLVVIGNPPYKNQAKGEGGWIEHGSEEQATPWVPLDDFQPSPEHHPGGNQTQELRNLYVYFWRWAIWKAFEAHANSPHGVIGFITSSAWLNAPGLVGMREHLHDVCDRLYVIDLGGAGRGGRTEPNVFAIKVPVAICVAVRDGSREGQPANVQYRRVRGDADEKLRVLTDLAADGPLEVGGWADVTIDPHEPIGAATTGVWRSYPMLTDLLPWRTRGIGPSRTWVYAPDPDILRRRWQTLVAEKDLDRRAELFHPTYHAQMDGDYPPLPGYPHDGPIADEAGPCPDPVQVGYRSFDVQWVIPDRRVLHSPSPHLWTVRSDRQVYLGHNHAARDPQQRSSLTRPTRATSTPVTTRPSPCGGTRTVRRRTSHRGCSTTSPASTTVM